MDELPHLTRNQSRRIDAIAIERYGIPGLVLMENAGRGVVDVLLEVDPGLASSLSPAPSPLRGGSTEHGRQRRPSAGATGREALGRGASAAEQDRTTALRSGDFGSPVLGCSHPRRGEGDSGYVVILCGKGNNAGDGFVIARHLQLRGVVVKVLLACSADQLTGDALVNYQILTHCDVPIIELPRQDVANALDRHAGGAAWLVDAMLGTGAVGEPREPVASIIRWMNARAARRLAVDLPSGLDCDTGRPAAATVRADVTCTFVAPKIGMLELAARPFVGELHVVSIGVPAGVIREAIQ